MKFEPDTEIDGLLRRHARRKAASASSGSEAVRGATHDERAAQSRVGGAHLDADEMNAYAEGALPEAARTRYFSHLADCDECRGLVTRLTLAANVATAPTVSQSTTTASPTRSWRDWLAAFFAPPVLRYGVPALALLAVMVVAFVALRERREANLVARNEQREMANEAARVNQNEQPVQPATGTTATTNQSVPLNENANPTVSEQRQADTTTEAATTNAQAGKREVAPEPDSPVQQSAPKPVEQPQTAPGADFGAQTRHPDEAVAMSKAQPPPTAAAPAARPPADNEGRKGAEDAKKAGELDEKNKAVRPATGTASVGGVVRDGATENSPTVARRAQKLGARERAGRSNRSDDAQSNSTAMTTGPEARDDGAGVARNAGGRQFRRRGGAWVDTAYSSSRSTINVARGSEQYRALVADEPGIRAIADQLGGTVIVVWKNRAYKIY